jgi:hypothetical protein
MERSSRFGETRLTVLRRGGFPRDREESGKPPFLFEEGENLFNVVRQPLPRWKFIGSIPGRARSKLASQRSESDGRRRPERRGIWRL